MLSEGRSVADVATATGATQRAVQKWARRLGLQRQGRGAGVEAEILAQEVLSRLLAGDQPAQIAADLQITAARVRQIRADFSVLTDGEEK